MVVSLLVPTSAHGAVRDKAPVAPAAAQAAEPTVADSETEAVDLARRTGRPVEVVSKRAESSDVFATPDGRLEAREYLRPVRARVDGQWQPVDTGLVRSGAGTVAPRAVTVGLEFSGGGDVPLVRMSKAGRDLTLEWPTSLPVPELRGDTVTYPEVLPGVDLRLGAQVDGFTQLLVVKSAQAAAHPRLAELRLRLGSGSLSVRETPSGGLEAVDEGSGGVVFAAPQPVMWDSSPGPAPVSRAAGRAPAAQPGQVLGGQGEPGAGESGTLAPVGVDIPADQSALVLRPDAGLLKGPDTVYPVFIDPQWHSPKATSWTMASKYWASSPQWLFNGDPDAGMGYCGWAYCQPQDTKRLFYQIPVSRFAGKTVLSAEFVVRNTWSASCSARAVELWRTKEINDQTTWNKQDAEGFWIERLRTASFSYGFDGCASKDAEFDVTAAVQKRVGKESHMTFGLRADSESDAYAWKRFSDDAYLRVKYNRPPPQVRMSQLTMEYGGVCKKPADAPRTRSLGAIYANNISDPDGDAVAVQFQATWNDGAGVWRGGLTRYKKSGSDFAILLPATIPQNRQIAWQVRTWDSAQFSPWSSAGDPTACYFVYDATAPRSPAITSGDYPASDPENPDDPWLDGTGKYGSFEVRGNSTQVTKYWYGLNTGATSANTVTTTEGAARTIKLLPTRAGLNTLEVISFDAAGNASAPASYRFRIKAGQPERVTWALDEPSGSQQAAGTAAERTADLHGGATTGVTGALGKAVLFDGVDDYARTEIPTVATDTGFSVSTWVKLSRKPGNTAIVAAQPGNHSPGFQLYYSTTYDRWAFAQSRSDTAGATVARAMQAQAGGVRAGEWVHLVGTHSSTENELKLYVDGELAGTTAYDSPWDARRGLQIGAGSSSGVPELFFPGAIDEVQIFDKPLAPGEVTRLHGKESLRSGRPARAVFAMDEAAGATQLTGVPEVLPAALHGGVTAGATGVVGKALELNGTSGYASTDRPMLNNQRGYAVAAWARLTKTKPNHAAVVVTQAGVNRPGFELYYSNTYDRWGVRAYTADTADAPQVRALQTEGSTARGGEWVHLVGVYDTVLDELTFYFNGRKAGSTALRSDWYAGGPVQIGAGQYGGQPGSFFPGRIDDVRLFDRPVSAGEVQQMFRQRPLVKARWTFEQSSGSPATTPDASASGHDMALHGGARVGRDKGGRVDGGMVLDGVDAYATADMPVDTTASFAVTGWAQAAAVPGRPVTLLSAPGAAQNAFAVRYEPSTTPTTDPGRWRVTTADKDASSASVTQVENGMFFGPTEWTHLALVYDGFDKQLSLYVNGELEEISCTDADGDGVADSAECAERTSWSEDVLTFSAVQSLRVGCVKTGATCGGFWPGVVSDLWAFQGTLSEAQIAKLAVGQRGMPTEVPGM
ncbi:LamG-like jellyroll fold domain-containing protein [Streptomyces sp. NPDC020965]|uniref:LamG-like jellyroll fold domain-containing protein n=1 Tax=Streptomyces sp. NPDC020965 TaxID=3365105 RepID=UPI00378B1709